MTHPSLGFICFVLSAAEQHDELGCEDTQEHRQRIYCRVADGRSLTWADWVGVSQCWRIGASTGKHTHNGEVVELELQSGYRTDYKNRYDSDKEACEHIHQAVAFYYCVPEVSTRLNTYAGKEEYKSNLEADHNTSMVYRIV